MCTLNMWTCNISMLYVSSWTCVLQTNVQPFSLACSTFWNQSDSEQRQRQEVSLPRRDVTNRNRKVIEWWSRAPEAWLDLCWWCHLPCKTNRCPSYDVRSVCWLTSQRDDIISTGPETCVRSSVRVCRTALCPHATFWRRQHLRRSHRSALKKTRDIKAQLSMFSC